MVFLRENNIITSLGFNSIENFEALVEGKTGIHMRSNQALYPEPFPASLVDTELLDSYFQKLNAKGNYTRLEKMLLLSISDVLSQSDVDITSPKTAIIISTTKGNIDLLEEKNKVKFPEDRIHLWKLGQIISEYFKNPNQAVVISNDCISGVLAINTAAMLINNGHFENIIVTGGDLASEFVVSGFMSFLSLSPNPCKPFDASRDGLSLGEGAGTILLSKFSGKDENIVFKGGATANDANHISGPSRTGEGSYTAIKKALTQAELNSKEIDHISSHGTATSYNDEMESIAISRHNMENVPVNSFKGNWGHTLGAAGIIEVNAMLHEMRINTLIQSAGFEKLGVSKEINIIQRNKKEELNTCLKMASGFGGSNAALVLQKV